jgi:hypothetical protein
VETKERIALIRKGNEFFNKGEIDNAIKIFIKTDYRDGLVRVGDYYYYEKRQPIMAFKFYKKAGVNEKVNEIFERMMFALGRLIRGENGKDKDASTDALKDTSNKTLKETIVVSVAPSLKKAAEEILKRNQS